MATGIPQHLCTYLHFSDIAKTCLMDWESCRPNNTPQVIHPCINFAEKIERKLFDQSGGT